MGPRSSSQPQSRKRSRTDDQESSGGINVQNELDGTKFHEDGSALSVEGVSEDGEDNYNAEDDVEDALSGGSNQEEIHREVDVDEEGISTKDDADIRSDKAEEDLIAEEDDDNDSSTLLREMTNKESETKKNPASIIEGEMTFRVRNAVSNDYFVPVPSDEVAWKLYGFASAYVYWLSRNAVRAASHVRGPRSVVDYEDLQIARNWHKQKFGPAVFRDESITLSRAVNGIPIPSPNDFLPDIRLAHLSGNVLNNVKFESKQLESELSPNSESLVEPLAIAVSLPWQDPSRHRVVAKESSLF